MQMTSEPFWLRIVSRTMIVFPVWRSPMMSSRWPRPMGMIASMAVAPGGGRRRAAPPPHDSGRQPLHEHVGIRLDRALAVERLPERIDDAPDEGGTGGHLHDPPRSFDLVALAHKVAFAEKDDADAFLLEVESQAEDAVRKLQELVIHDPVETVNAGDAVSNRCDGPDLADVHAGFVALDLLLNDLRDFVGLDAHDDLSLCSICSFIRLRLPRTDAS
jgi:hypothetical protein